MKHIILSSGRKVLEGEPYHLEPGEFPIDHEHTNEEGELVSTDLLPKLEKEGIQWGDAIAWVTHKMGVKQCAPCKARQEILNNASKLGWAETVRQIKSTLKT